MTLRRIALAFALVLALPNPAGAAGAPIGTLVNATAAINTTETVVLSIPTGPVLSAGMPMEVDLSGTCTSSAANVSTFALRYGTLGTTADTTIGTFTVTAATTGVAVPFAIRVLLVVRTAGAAGTVAGIVRLMNSGATGIATTPDTVATLTTSGALNTTLDGKLSISYKSAASTTTSTFTVGLLRVN